VPKEKTVNTTPAATPQVDLGESLFGVKRSAGGNANPFSTSSNSSGSSNPFAATSSLAAKPAQKPTEAESLPQTFAQKAQISTPPPATTSNSTPVPSTPWPEQSAFPEPYPSYHLDADKEWIDQEKPQPVPAQARVDLEADGGSGGMDAKEAFESSMDKAFQKFADRLAQNPEQVLRYEFAGQPLLYSNTDAVGKLLAPEQGDANATVKTQASSSNKSFMPKCGNCGAARVFELQLTPHVITELEAEEMSIDGMDWGTIILGVCSKDCNEKGKGEGDVGYVEEWTGVQWEELAKQQRPS
jgi:pre-rRNA-processing protein TSR4